VNAFFIVSIKYKNKSAGPNVIRIYAKNGGYLVALKKKIMVIS
jgi:hypothetical protein